MTITSIVHKNGYLEITEDGQFYRKEVRWEDTIVSAIESSGQYEVVNVYYRTSDGHLIVVYTDGVTQSELDINPAAMAGDMTKAVYDIDNDGVVDNAEKLEGSTKAQVQDHTPKAHKISHQDTGDDEIDVTGLAGLLVDDQHVLDAEAKAAAIAGWLASRALQVNAGGTIEVSPVTLAELGYVDGVTSGIQGQIDGKVAQATFDDHHVRHEWEGADEYNPRLKLADLRQIAFMCWDTHDAWTEALVGTGSIDWELFSASFKTGGGIGGIASAYTGRAVTGFYGSATFRAHATLTSLTNNTAWLVSIDAIAPGDIAEHIGFKIINGRIWATNADGAVQTITDTGVDFVAFGLRRLMYVVSSDRSTVYFYVNGTLLATHTTNIPPAGQSRFLFYIINGAAANKILRVSSLHFLRD